jgi:hypothetical protein
MMNTPATQLPGAADPDVKIGEVVVKPNPRQVAIDAMTARMEEARETELADAVAADPGLAMSQAAMDNQIAAANAEAIADGTLAPPELDDGAASRKPMHPAPGTPAVDPLPADIAADPLSEFVEMKDGKPMFRAKVNGEDRLIPLDQARRQIQIGTAAEVRMQQAAAFEQRTTQEAEQRERDLQIKEAALAQRTAVAPQPGTPPAGDFSDEDLLDEAREIFNTAFSGTEEDAAKKLARTLSKLRAPTAVVQPAQRIDEGAIVKKAARAAVTAVQNVDKQKDVDTGYAQFQTDYPDIMADPKLYKMADDMTDEIERENPTWRISQVMEEAGKRTRAWVSELTGQAPVETPKPPTVPNTSTLTPHPPNRQERKSELVRMPTAAAAAVHQTPADEPEHEQTPVEAFAALKASRGQPV